MSSFTASARERVILHLDMDAFYAAVEVREDPALAGKPLIIGHRGRRGVVSTCSYEARRFGVRSAMPSLTAERLCPDATWLPGRMDLYVRVSHAIRSILAGFTPIIEPLSIDEAFLDLSGIARDLQAGREVAVALKQRIRTQERLTASVGVAPNKFLAKLASDMEKPDGLVVFPLSLVPERLWPLPVGRLWGVGPKTAQRLESGRIRIVRDLVESEAEVIARLVGESAAHHLRALARGEDTRPVVPEHEAKSMSEERTYLNDLRAPDEIDESLLARAEGVARQLRAAGLRGRTVHLKVRTGDFTTWTRAHTLDAATDLAEVIVSTARMLFRERIHLGGRGVRLLGVGMSGLEPATVRSERQFELFATRAADPDSREERLERLARATDAVRKRLGRDVLKRARLLGKPERDPGEGEASSLPSVD